MSEDISRLMDGEADDATAERVWRKAGDPQTRETWASYHVIGDALRGTATPTPGFTARFAARLDAEPTVLAPPRRVAHAASWAWAAAATVAAVAVVGMAAMSLTEAPATALAKAREATSVRADQLRPQVLPADYLLAHQEYSPATAMQGVGPYVRAVAAPVSNARR